MNIQTAQTSAIPPVAYFDRAMAALKSLNFYRDEDSAQPEVALVASLSGVDEARAVAIARVLQQSSRFSEIVRDELTSVTLSDRYTDIVKAFDSIRDDATRLVEQAQDGKIDVREKLQNAWMRVFRGDISDRFDRIRDTFLAVSRDSGDQLERESKILDMYADFRFALKEAEIQAHELLQLQEQALKAAQATLASAQETLDRARVPGRESVGTSAVIIDPAPPHKPVTELMADYGRMVMVRDEALRAVQSEDERYQVAKDLADNLQVAYATSEAVMARVRQAHQVKMRVNQRSITFFSTNETVLTALNAAFVTQLGLHESTQTLNAMVDGINKGIETVADVGDQLLKDGLKAGYGGAISVESVRKLVDSVTNFQQTVGNDIQELRENATRDAAEISSYVEQGKRRYASLVSTTGVQQQDVIEVEEG